MLECTSALLMPAIVLVQISPAKQARPFHEPSGPREQGFVARYSETFGFIRYSMAFFTNQYSTELGFIMVLMSSRLTWCSEYRSIVELKTRPVQQP